MKKTRIVIPGKPISQHRPRFARRGKFTITYSDQETEAGLFYLKAKKQVTECLEGALRVDCKFFMKRPKGHYGTGKNAGIIKESAPTYPIGKRDDIDNCLKFAFDCLNGLAWKDDCQVIILSACKIYHEQPQTIIEIEKI